MCGQREILRKKKLKTTNIKKSREVWLNERRMIQQNNKEILNQRNRRTDLKSVEMLQTQINNIIACVNKDNINAGLFISLALIVLLYHIYFSM